MTEPHSRGLGNGFCVGNEPFQEAFTWAVLEQISSLWCSLQRQRLWSLTSRVCSVQSTALGSGSSGYSSRAQQPRLQGS